MLSSPSARLQKALVLPLVVLVVVLLETLAAYEVTRRVGNRYARVAILMMMYGVGFALAAAVCWAAYIVLTQRVGDLVPGVTGLAVSIPVAALVATAVAGPATIGRLTPEIVLVGLGMAVLLPLVPFSLEMLALRRLNTAAFGTLMSLEPAFALLIGLVVLQQVPGWLATVGVACVVVAGIGAERGGARPAAPPPPATPA